MAKLSAKLMKSGELAALRRRRIALARQVVERHSPRQDERSLLVINGVVPLGEPVRSGRRACRCSAARRILRVMERDEVILLALKPWDERRIYKRLVLQIVDDLEAEGLIEYRRIAPPEAAYDEAQHGVIAT